MFDLKPCPFCMSNNLSLVGAYHYKCLECNCKGPVAETRKEAKDKWNNRLNKTKPKIVIDMSSFEVIEDY